MKAPFNIATGLCVTLLLAMTYWVVRPPAYNASRWSEAEVELALCEHLNDPNWVPIQLKDGGYIVVKLDGSLVKPPTKETK